MYVSKINRRELIQAVLALPVVALLPCETEYKGIKRIWLDCKLIYDNGNWIDVTQWRNYEHLSANSYRPDVG
jgi:hypothetical protein